MATEATVEQQVLAGDNTRDAREKKCRGFRFTYNMKGATLATVEHHSSIIDALNMACVDTWAFQLECGKEGTYHYQGQMYFKGPRSFECVRRILGRANIGPLTDCRGMIKYNTKDDDTFVRGPWAKGIEVVYREAKIWNDRPWQAQLREKIEVKDDRSIIWIYDPEGCMGKTTFAKHLIQTRPRTLFCSGKANDAQYAVATLVKQGKAPDLVMFGFPRSKEAYVSYEAMENIKDGLFFNGKYEAGMVCFDSPTVVVLANFAPNYESMTKDRWKVYTIEDMNLVEWGPGW